MEEEKKRREWFYKNWPFKLEITEEEHWNSQYHCFHCERKGTFKNYRTEEGEGMTYIMCEYKDCSGNAMDMSIVDPYQEEVMKMFEADGSPDDLTDEDWENYHKKAKERLQIQGQ